jgi:hypothetical protein
VRDRDSRHPGRFGGRPPFHGLTGGNRFASHDGSRILQVRTDWENGIPAKIPSRHKLSL